MTLSDLERRDARGQISLEDLCKYIRLYHLLRTTKFGILTHGGEACFRESDTTPIVKDGTPAPSKFLGPLIHVSTRYDKQQPNFAWQSNLMRGKFLRVDHVPSPGQKFL